MKPTAFLVNIGRGKLVDEPALIRALQEKWIAGAGLDTFVEEPLPSHQPALETAQRYSDAPYRRPDG